MEGELRGREYEKDGVKHKILSSASNRSESWIALSDEVRKSLTAQKANGYRGSSAVRRVPFRFHRF